MSVVSLGDTERAYLIRLGLDPEPPSVDALDRLHRAHVERVPYETAWIHEGRRWTTDPDAAMARIAHDGRGGYCYHLNGALALLLAALGYRVSRVCTVQRRRPGGGVDILRGRVFRAADGADTTFGDDDADAWFDLVTELGVRLPAESRDALWTRVSAAHAAHHRTSDDDLAAD